VADTRRGGSIAALVLAISVAATGCTASPSPLRSSALPTAPTSAPSAEGGHWSVAGEPEVLARGLVAPWSVIPLAAGGALISQRDDGTIRELTVHGALRDVGVVPDVVSGGEAGLNGIALHEVGDRTWLYAYHATRTDNRVVRMPLEGSPGSYRLGPAEAVLTGIATAGNHDGGRLAFGPDGMLYVTTGDAGRGDAAQDRDSLNGKILRLTPDGRSAPGNPFGTAVWSYGHRNVQGIAWSGDGVMWASEFGQNTWDELNRIEPGANYGWPVVEGTGSDNAFRNPVAQWATDEASPSGIAAIGDTIFLAALRGERLWRVDTRGGAIVGDAQIVLDGLGRLRDAAVAPDGSLWVLTNNTDGRGSPRDGDDLLLRIPLARAD